MRLVLENNTNVRLRVVKVFLTACDSIEFRVMSISVLVVSISPDGDRVEYTILCGFIENKNLKWNISIENVTKFIDRLLVQLEPQLIVIFGTGPLTDCRKDLCEKVKTFLNTNTRTQIIHYCFRYNTYVITIT